MNRPATRSAPAEAAPKPTANAREERRTITFTEPERAYLAEPRLGRLATADVRGRPHVVPTGFRFDPTEGVIDIGGHDLAGTKKFRNARANPQVAFVVDDLVSTNPWRVRAVEVRGE